MKKQWRVICAKLCGTIVFMFANFPLILTLGGMMLVIGLIAGFIAGLLGVGGGIIVVPGLYYSLDKLGYDKAILMHTAVGTSLAIIVATAISSTRAHTKRKAVDLKLLKSWGPAILAGVALGAAFSAVAPGKTLVLFFACATAFISLYLITTGENLHLSKKIPAQPLQSIFGVIIGLVSTMMGIGGATLSVPAMTLLRVPIRTAIGTAAAIGLIISIPGSIGFMISGHGHETLPPLSIGYVNILAVALIAPFTVLVAPLGARFAHSLPTHVLRKIFGFFLSLVSLRMFLTAL